MQDPNRSIRSTTKHSEAAPGSNKSERNPNCIFCTWMCLLGCPGKEEIGSMVRINGLFHLINGVYWGYNLLILTIDPNFLGHPSSWWCFYGLYHGIHHHEIPPFGRIFKRNFFLSHRSHANPRSYYHMTPVKKRPPGCFGYIGDEILPSYVGIITNHYPYKSKFKKHFTPPKTNMAMENHHF